MEYSEVFEIIRSCPSKPNCFSSFFPASNVDAAPWPIKKEVSIIKLLRKKIAAMPNAALEESGESYLHFVFKSSIFGFKDDLWLLWQEEPGHLIFRSSSRVGYFDFGVNEARIREIKSLIGDSISE